MNLKTFTLRIRLRFFGLDPRSPLLLLYLNQTLKWKIDNNEEMPLRKHEDKYKEYTEKVHGKMTPNKIQKALGEPFAFFKKD